MSVKIAKAQFSIVCTTKLKTDPQKILKSHFSDLVCYVKNHVFANFGHDIIDLAMDMAMTMVNWLRIHECSYMIVKTLKKL